MKTARRPLPASRYQEYICSDDWVATKTWWRSHHSSARRRCRCCGDRHYQLHHRTYVRLGMERLHDLVPLCKHHHDGVGRWETVLRRMCQRRATALRWATRLYVASHRRATWLAAVAFAVAVLVLR